MTRSLFRHITVPVLALGLWTTLLIAETQPRTAVPAETAAADVDALFAALGLPAILDVMRQEGIAYADQIAADMLPGGASADWTRAVDAIYDTDRMAAEVRASFGTALDGADLAPILAFFQAEPGRTIIDLEVSARRAMLDDAVEEAAKDNAAIARADATPRFALIEEFAQVNDLIETNVVGGMNSNFAFYMGLMDGGAFARTLTEDQILTDVWGQEAEIRTTTAEWVYSFLMLAYQPLDDADLQTYIAFSQTPAGVALNRAVFDGFDAMFTNVSRALGVAAAAEMMTQEL